MIRVAVLALTTALLLTAQADARNTPCSGKKGGVKACQGDKYLCNNGTISASKRACSR